MDSRELGRGLLAGLTTRELTDPEHGAQHL